MVALGKQVSELKIFQFARFAAVMVVDSYLNKPPSIQAALSCGFQLGILMENRRTELGITITDARLMTGFIEGYVRQQDETSLHVHNCGNGFDHIARNAVVFLVNFTEGKRDEDSAKC